MCCILFKITYKGQQIKKYVFDDKIKRFCCIHVLITTKSTQQGYHYIININTNHIIIPNTLIIPTQSAILQITIHNKTYKIPIHALTQFNETIEKNMVIDLTI